MGKLFVIALAALVSLCSARGADPGVHLFILSGQSNMAALDPNVSFTPAVANAFGKDNVIVVKDAQGGQPIRRWYKQWRPAEGKTPETKEKGGKPPANGDLYDRLMAKVNAAIQNKKVQTVTFVWMQGERDAKEEQGSVYAASLKGLVRQLSNDLSRQDIHVVIGRINDAALNKKVYPHGAMVRNAQVEVAESLPAGAWVDTDDLNGPGNGIHATKQGYRTLGERFAGKAVELISKRTP